RSDRRAACRCGPPRAELPVSDLEARIASLWDAGPDLAGVMSEDEARATVREAIELLDTGAARVAEVVDGEVVVHEWLKQAILLLFRLSKMETIGLGPFGTPPKTP